MTASTAWPEFLPVAQVRVARPTDRLDDVTRFYRDALGLPDVFRFDGHAGYDGVMFGLPWTGYHLEFTTHVDASPGLLRRGTTCWSSTSMTLSRNRRPRLAWRGSATRRSRPRTRTGRTTEASRSRTRTVGGSC